MTTARSRRRVRRQEEAGLCLAAIRALRYWPIRVASVQHGLGMAMNELAARNSDRAERTLSDVLADLFSFSEEVQTALERATDALKARDHPPHILWGDGSTAERSQASSTPGEPGSTKGAGGPAGAGPALHPPDQSGQRPSGTVTKGGCAPSGWSSARATPPDLEDAPPTAAPAGSATAKAAGVPGDGGGDRGGGSFTTRPYPPSDVPPLTTSAPYGAPSAPSPTPAVGYPAALPAGREAAPWSSDAIHVATGVARWVGQLDENRRLAELVAQRSSFDPVRVAVANAASWSYWQFWFEHGLAAKQHRAAVALARRLLPLMAFTRDTTLRAVARYQSAESDQSPTSGSGTGSTAQPG